MLINASWRTFGEIAPISASATIDVTEFHSIQTIGAATRLTVWDGNPQEDSAKKLYTNVGQTAISQDPVIIDAEIVGDSTGKKYATVVLETPGEGSFIVTGRK